MNAIARFSTFTALALVAALEIPSRSLFADDWPMLGRDRTRNSVSPEKNPPLDWDVDTGRNIKWRSALGSYCFSTPVVANGMVWVGTNYRRLYDPKTPDGMAGVLMCFRESDGKFLYQHISATRKGLPLFWTQFGAATSPLVEGNRLWFTTTRAEILCLDLGPLQQGSGIPHEAWKLDEQKDLGIHPAGRGFMDGGLSCSIGASHGELIYVMTANGTDIDLKIPAPDAPALVCLNKNTGKVVWQDSSSSKDVILGERGNPLVIEVNGRAQVVAPQGDGWLRSFDALTGELIWKFDINPKSADRRRREKNYFLGAPVLYEGKLYIGSGQGVEEKEGPGRLCCIDPSKHGDISLELEDGPGKGKPNPNSGEVWHFDEIGRMHAAVAVHHGLVIAAGCLSGIVYCLDAKTGRQQWRHDTMADIRSSPLIVDDKVYVADEDGVIHIWGLSPEKRSFAEMQMDGFLRSSPVFANGVLYVATEEYLYAIQEGHSTPPPPKQATGAKP